MTVGGAITNDKAMIAIVFIRLIADILILVAEYMAIGTELDLQD